MKHVKTSDLRAAAALATQATQGAARIAEGVHQSVWSTLGVPAAAPGRTRGLTGLVYRCVGGITQAVGLGLDSALTRLESLFGAVDAAPPDSPQRLAVVSALNGVMGDRLLADANPLALPMSLHHDGKPVDPDAPSGAAVAGGKILLLVHGLCMNDQQWQTWRTASDGTLEPGLDHGQVLARTQGFTPLYLRYNTGRHVSDNGQELSALLQRLLGAWPVPVRELVIVGHSMGGLVARSAVFQAQQRSQDWIERLTRIVFLGTPHHGAPLERAGNWVDRLLGSTPWSAPFARLARLRSCGITDLRHGHLLADDGPAKDRFKRHTDTRRQVPLPAGIACLAVAATLAGRRSLVAERLLGDGLVPLRSALGQHDDPARSLAFGPHDQAIAYRTGHMQLLSDPAVARVVGDWLQGSHAATPSISRANP